MPNLLEQLEKIESLIMKDEILKQFCSPPGSDYKEVFKSLFYLNGWVYASDGRVVVRYHKTGSENTKDAPKKVEQIFIDQFRVSTSPLKMPDPLPPIVFIECDECCGKGKFADDYLCDECDGAGKSEETTGIEIGNRKINIKYLHLISKLEDVRIHADVGRELDPLPFTFKDGGQGLLMPMRKA